MVDDKHVFIVEPTIGEEKSWCRKHEEFIRPNLYKRPQESATWKAKLMMQTGLFICMLRATWVPPDAIKMVSPGLHHGEWKSDIKSSVQNESPERKAQTWQQRQRPQYLDKLQAPLHLLSASQHATTAEGDMQGSAICGKRGRCYTYLQVQQ